MTKKTRVAFSIWLVVTGSLQADSIIFPKFSAPLFQKDRLICTSPDSKRVLCINLNGRRLWERSFGEAVNLIAGPNSEPLLQTGKVVNLLVTQSGALQPRFTAEHENDVVAYVKDARIFVSTDRRFEKRTFKIIDENTGKPLWKSTEVENLIGVTPELIVTLAAERIPYGRGFRFRETSLEAFDRSAFQKKWSVLITEKDGSPYLDAALKPPYLIYAHSENSLTVLDCTTGRKLVTTSMALPKYGRIWDVKIFGDEVAWLTCDRSHAYDANPVPLSETPHFLHFCTLPNLQETKAVTLKLIEIASVAFEGEFIISDALYRTACFRKSGEKVWERFQSNRTETIDNRIYFSDFYKETTRLGYVEVPTGKETILYSEKVE
jgi:hypothetical protein